MLRTWATWGALACASAGLAIVACSSDDGGGAQAVDAGDADAGADPIDASEAGDLADLPNPELDAVCTPTVDIEMAEAGANGAYFTDAVPDPVPFIQETGRRVCRILYRNPGEVRAANHITLVLQDDKIPGWKSGDVGDITVMISTSHLADVSSAGQDVKLEIQGVLTHEMTHMYQNDDKAPGEGTYARLGNVIEGIADAVRIRAKLPPTGSAPSKIGQWDDQGYWKPAYFLLWIDDQYPNFVYQLNQSMAIGDGKAWTPDSFADITGETVSDLWTRYKSAACCSAADRSCCY